MTPPEPTVMLEALGRPPTPTVAAVKVVPVASRMPATAISAGAPLVLLKATESPEAKLSVPLSVSVTPCGIWTLAPAPTTIETPDATVVGPPNVEGPAPIFSVPPVRFSVASEFVVKLSTESD
jgi:hypothetical protein